MYRTSINWERDEDYLIIIEYYFVLIVESWLI